MSEMQLIRYKGQLAAAVVGDVAMLDRGLVDEQEILDVKAMCLFATEVALGEHPGPYTDDAALAYATDARRARAADAN